MAFVRIKNKTVPYLDKAVLEEYSSLTLISKEGQKLKLNPLILAAMDSKVITDLADSEGDQVVITEFSKVEIEEIVNFSLGEPSDTKITTLMLEALGIDPLLLCSSMLGHLDQSAIKKELDDPDYSPVISEEDEDECLATKYKKKINTLETPRKRGRPKKSPDEPKSKRKLETKFRSSSVNRSLKDLSQEEIEHFLNYELPKPIDDYRSPPMGELAQDISKPPKTGIGTERLPCLVCGKLVSPRMVRSHFVKFHCEHFKCPHCLYSFITSDADAFKLHVFRHNHVIRVKAPKEPCICIQCGASFPAMCHLQSHLKIKGPHHNDECSHCDKKMRSYEDHKAHVEQEHESKWKIRCGHSKEVFDHVAELRHHVRQNHWGLKRKARCHKKSKEKEKKVCEECGNSVYNLQSHLETVHGDLNLPCPECDRVFKSYAYMFAHQRAVHEKVPCQHCGEMVSVGRMRFHNQQKHEAIYGRKYKCEFCGKGFADLRRVKEHTNTHTGNKPYKCKFCSAAFASKGTARTHQISHLGIKRAK